VQRTERRFGRIFVTVYLTVSQLPVGAVGAVSSVSDYVDPTLVVEFCVIYSSIELCLITFYSGQTSLLLLCCFQWDGA